MPAVVVDQGASSPSSARRSESLAVTPAADQWTKSRSLGRMVSGLTALGGFGSEFDFFQRYGCRISKGFYRMGTRNGL